MKRPVFPGPFRRGLRRLGAAGLAAGTLWAVVVTAGSDSASAAWAALRAASPLAALKWELGDLWADDDLSPAAVMTLGESPLLLSARAAVAELWSTERTEESGADGREETVTEPVEETPLETTGETDNGVPARTLVPTDPSGYTVCGRSYISNSTDHALTVTELSEPFDARLADGEPQILILHTHGSEAYTPPPGTDIVWSGNYRTTDSRYNVVGVGDEMAEVFTAAGISVLHDRTLYDYSSYNDAYNNALAAIETYLAEYPSIRFILDVHRDAIGDAEGNQYKVISEIDGVGTSAQMTLVMGSDGSGLAHEHWMENLKLAVALQDNILQSYPTLMRPILLRNSRYNQHATTGSLLVEVGTAGNAPEEAELAARLFGLEILAPDIHTIKNNCTRFMILRPDHQPIDEKADKASLCLMTDHRQGSLLQVLRAMEDSSINMTKLQSSPIPSEPWHYMFHIDMEFASMDDYNEVIERMRRASRELHVYGVYRRGEHS